jgi:hypothetical protein
MKKRFIFGWFSMHSGEMGIVIVSKFLETVEVSTSLAGHAFGLLSTHVKE